MDENKVKKIIELSEQGLTNLEIARHPEVMLKHATLCSWKRKLKQQGREVKSQVGRPVNK